MREITCSTITDAIKKMCIEAATILPQDVEKALSQKHDEEDSALAKKTLQVLMDNAKLAQEKQMPPSASLVLPCAHRPPMIPIKIFSSVIGSSLILTPTALYTAFAIAGDGVLITISPMDFAPNGPVGS